MGRGGRGEGKKRGECGVFTHVVVLKGRCSAYKDLRFEILRVSGFLWGGEGGNKLICLRNEDCCLRLEGKEEGGDGVFKEEIKGSR